VARTCAARRARSATGAAGSHETRLLHIDNRGLDWHVDCYALIMQQPAPSACALGRLLRFQR
jgi:hypothetical protein